jgi:hypothetical protein
VPEEAGVPDERLFVVARHPRRGSGLRYVLQLPVTGERPLLLATHVPWPAGKDAYCHELARWPDGAEVLESVPVRSCRRVGAAVHLLLARRQRQRSVFVWVGAPEKRAVFWRTPKTVAASRPGLRVPAARGVDRPIAIAVDVREQSPWRFPGTDATLTSRELPAGDYGVFDGRRLVAVVERKTVDDLVGGCVSGRLAFALEELGQVPRAVLVVEGRLSQALKQERVRAGWLLGLIAGLQAAHPGVGWVFAETRTLAESFAYRWLAAAVLAGRGVRDPAAALDEPAPQPGEAGFEVAPPAPRAAQLGLPVYDRSGRTAAAIELAAAGHFWTTAAYAEHFSVSKATAYQDLCALVQAGALQAVGATRGRRYVRAERPD